MRDIQIVAEIGCNHNGSVETAKKMMFEAKNAGVNHGLAIFGKSIGG